MSGGEGARTSEPELPPRLGRFEVVGRLATGGMAELLMARATGPGGFERLIAIKRLLPELGAEEAVVRGFLDEARLSANLNHRNIVSVYEAERLPEGVILVMELLRGRDLRAVLRRLAARRARTPLGLALAIVQRLCLGLDYAHELTDEQGRPLGLVHRDVSPHNVHLGFDGEVKLLDFGIAKAQGRLGGTRAGHIKGKAGYMSPEQCRGRTIDRRSDIFSLGIVLYELTTNRRLYDGRDDYERLRATVEEPARRPSADVPGYPAKLERLVMSALDHDPARRPRTAMELFEQLDEVRRAEALLDGERDLQRFMGRLFPAELAALVASRGEPQAVLRALRDATEDDGAPGEDERGDDEARPKPSARLPVATTSRRGHETHTAPWRTRRRSWWIGLIGALAGATTAAAVATAALRERGALGEARPPARSTSPRTDEPVRSPPASADSPPAKGLSTEVRLIPPARASPPASPRRGPPRAPKAGAAGRSKPPEPMAEERPATPSSSPASSPASSPPVSSPPVSMEKPAPSAAPVKECRDDDCVL